MPVTTERLNNRFYAVASSSGNIREIRQISYAKGGELVYAPRRFEIITTPNAIRNSMNGNLASFLYNLFSLGYDLMEGRKFKIENSVSLNRIKQEYEKINPIDFLGFSGAIDFNPIPYLKLPGTDPLTLPDRPNLSILPKIDSAAAVDMVKALGIKNYLHYLYAAGGLTFEEYKEAFHSCFSPKETARHNYLIDTKAYKIASDLLRAKGKSFSREQRKLLISDSPKARKLKYNGQIEIGGIKYDIPKGFSKKELPANLDRLKRKVEDDKALDGMEATRRRRRKRNRPTRENR